MKVTWERPHVKGNLVQNQHSTQGGLAERHEWAGLGTVGKLRLLLFRTAIHVHISRHGGYRLHRHRHHRRCQGGADRREQKSCQRQQSQQSSDREHLHRLEACHKERLLNSRSRQSYGGVFEVAQVRFGLMLVTDERRHLPCRIASIAAKGKKLTLAVEHCQIGLSLRLYSCNLPSRIPCFSDIVRHSLRACKFVKEMCEASFGLRDDQAKF